MNIFHGIFILLICSQAWSQDSTENTRIEVKGKVVDSTQHFPGYNLMVVNQSLGRGVFGGVDGSFKATIGKEDTLVLSTHGYKIVKLSFKDSVYRPQYELTIYLEQVGRDLGAVVVKRRRTLEELTEARKSLAAEDTRIVTGVDVLRSPITALYQKFSKIERSKALVAEMEKDYEKSQILKELFKLYVDNNIINLEDEEFDDFISFLNISDQLLKSLDDYDLAVYIQDKFDHWSRLNDFYYEKEEPKDGSNTQTPEGD